MDAATIIGFTGRDAVTDPLTDLLRNGARELLQAAAVEAERDAFLAEFAGRRTAEGRAAVDADDNEHAKPIVRSAQPAVDTIRPDVDPFVAAQIDLAPIVVFCCPLALRERDRLRRKNGRIRAQQHLQSCAHPGCSDLRSHL